MLEGNNPVSFDIVELEMVQKPVEIVPEMVKLEAKTDIPLFEDETPEEPVIFTDDFSDEDELSMEESISEPESSAEETKSGIAFFICSCVRPWQRRGSSRVKNLW